jgi:hypothetical protein
MDEEQILDMDTLVDARDKLDKRHGGDSISRLADCVCTLMEGFLDKLIEEQRE